MSFKIKKTIVKTNRKKRMDRGSLIPNGMKYMLRPILIHIKVTNKFIINRHTVTRDFYKLTAVKLRFKNGDEENVSLGLDIFLVPNSKKLKKKCSSQKYKYLVLHRDTLNHHHINTLYDVFSYLPTI